MAIEFWHFKLVGWRKFFSRLLLTLYTISCYQEILCDTDRSMSVFLQDKSMFSLLGQCAAYPSRSDQLLRVQMVDDNQSKSSNDGAVSGLIRQVWYRGKNNNCQCGCNELEGLLGKHRLAAVGSSHWIHMEYDSDEIHGRNIHWIPKLHHIHWSGKIVSQCDVHVCKSWSLYCMIYVEIIIFCGGKPPFYLKNQVIFYEAPRYGSHHFSLSFWNSSKQVKALLEKPKWVYELHQKQPLNDLVKEFARFFFCASIPLYFFHIYSTMIPIFFSLNFSNPGCGHSCYEQCHCLQNGFRETCGLQEIFCQVFYYLHVLSSWLCHLHILVLIYTF